MFGIGPTEFIIIAVVALMLFSPRELPKILRSAAKFWASLRNTADEFRDAIMNEEEMHDIRAALKGGVADIKKAEAAARRELMKARMEMQKAQNKLLKTVKAAEESKREDLGLGSAGAAPSDGAPAIESAAPVPADPAHAGSAAATGPDADVRPAAPDHHDAPSANSGDVAHADPHADEAAVAPPGVVPAARPDRPAVGQGAA